MFLAPEHALIAAAILTLVVIYYTATAAATATATDWFEDEPAGGSGDKDKCRSKAKKSLWAQYDWRQRKLNNGKWKCDRGWEDTGCSWTMGKEFETKQCRRKRSDAAKYEEAAKSGTMSAELTVSDNARKGRSRCRKYRDGKTVNPAMTASDIAWCYSHLKGFKTPAPAATEAPQSGTTIDNTGAVTEKPGSRCTSSSECTGTRYCSSQGYCADPETIETINNMSGS